MKLAMFVLAGILVLVGVGEGKTIQVPNDYGKIQEAIDASTNGDTVLVAPGIYVENINFIGKAITVQSIDGSEVTIIDGSQPMSPNAGSVVRFISGEGSSSVLDGFTVTNGTGSVLPPFNYKYGGGILCLSSSPNIINNIITQNTPYAGGGIYCRDHASPHIEKNVISNHDIGNRGGGGILCIDQCAPMIIDNTIFGNTAGEGAGIICFGSSPTIQGNRIFGNSAVYGGGICLQALSSPLISHNLIAENDASAVGGGIECFFECSPAIEHNRIVDNTALNAGAISCYDLLNHTITIKSNIISDNVALDKAGCIWLDASMGSIASNIITENSAGTMGGGFLSVAAIATLTNNTFSKNTAGTEGGGMRCMNLSHTTVVNTVLWDNDGQTGDEISIGTTEAPSTLTIRYSDVEGGQPMVHVEPGCTLNWGAGMFDLDPRFVDPAAGDFHIFHDSPCTGRGDNSAPGLLAEDFEGDPRIAYGTVDMGADEFYTHLYWTGDATPGGNVEIKFMGLPGTSPVGLCIGTGVLNPPLKSMWGDWYLAFPIIGPIDMPQIPTPGVLVVPGNIPASPPPPYYIPMQALIGAELTNLSVLEVK